MLQEITSNLLLQHEPLLYSRQTGSTCHAHVFATIPYFQGYAVVLWGKKVEIFNKPFQDNGDLLIFHYTSNLQTHSKLASYQTVVFRVALIHQHLCKYLSMLASFYHPAWDNQVDNDCNDSRYA